MLKTERSRRGTPWRSTVSDQREREEKVKCCCGRITEGGDPVEEAFCEQQLKPPKEPVELWWYPEPFWEGRAQAYCTRSWKCFYAKGGKHSPKRITPYFNYMG